MKPRGFFEATIVPLVFARRSGSCGEARWPHATLVSRVLIDEHRCYPQPGCDRETRKTPDLEPDPLSLPTNRAAGRRFKSPDGLRDLSYIIDRRSGLRFRRLSPDIPLRDHLAWS